MELASQALSLNLTPELIQRSAQQMKRLLLLLLLTGSRAIANEKSIIDRIETMRAKQAEEAAQQNEAQSLADRQRWRAFPCTQSYYPSRDRTGLPVVCYPKEYDWQGWVRAGTIYTTYRRSPNNMLSTFGQEKISVDCRILQIKEYMSKSNELRLASFKDPVIRERFKSLATPEWRLPEQGSETAMVAARCSSTQ